MVNGDGQRHHFGETFFPALVWALDQDNMNKSVVENILISVLSVFVGEEEERNKTRATIDKQEDEREGFNREEGNENGDAPNIEGKL